MVLLRLARLFSTNRWAIYIAIFGNVYFCVYSFLTLHHKCGLFIFLGNTWNLKPLHPIFGFVFKILQRHVQVSMKQLAASRERDFFRWVKLPLPIYKACVPVKLDAGATSNFDGRGTAEISMILPSDHLAALHQAGERVPSQHGFFNVLTYLHDCFIVSPPYCCHRTFELCATRSGNAWMLGVLERYGWAVESQRQCRFVIFAHTNHYSWRCSASLFGCPGRNIPISHTFKIPVRMGQYINISSLNTFLFINLNLKLGGGSNFWQAALLQSGVGAVGVCGEIPGKPNKP